MDGQEILPRVTHWYKGKDNTAFYKYRNEWRKKRRLRYKEEGFCTRCGKQMIEESGNANCINCHETRRINNFMQRNFNGDN